MCQIESQVCMPHLRKCAPHDWHNPICLACEPVEFSFPSFLLLFFVWFIFQAVNAVCWLLDEFMQLKSYLARSQLPKKKKTPTFSSMCVLTKAGSTSKDRKEILLIKAARPECADPSCCFPARLWQKGRNPSRLVRRFQGAKKRLSQRHGHRNLLFSAESLACETCGRFCVGVYVC